MGQRIKKYHRRVARSVGMQLKSGICWNSSASSGKKRVQYEKGHLSEDSTCRIKER